MNLATNIPFTDFGGHGERMHFAHANGYPPGCYGELISELREHYRLFAMHYRPLWENSDYTKLRNWKSFADDLIYFLDQESQSNLIGVGHSMGASTTIVAAKRRPDLFKKLILIEPVILPMKVYWIRLLPISLRSKVFPLVKMTEKRKDRWESKEALFESFRKKKVFSKISDHGLRLFAEHATRPSTNGGIELSYSKKWEARVYSTPFYPWNYLKKLTQPTLIIRAEYTDVLSSNIWLRLQDTIRNGTFVDMKHVGHLAPLEEPKLVSAKIRDWLNHS